NANPASRRASSYAGGTRWDSGINRNFVMVSSNESLNNSLMFRATGVIKTMTQMPLIILLLSTIAVINTMVVSVRSRRWEMGILRACGVTRWGLVRMILAEALLIGLCACVLSFCFGLFYAWVATSMVTLAPMFGVIAPPLTIPWTPLAQGFALAIGVCALAGAWPALAAGLTETSKLLQNKE
ncbi:MAG: ABC transporter permease, partial [Victivallales bacterium]|nr:ABC transporter permease [Victivallales bacterium]